MSDHSGHDHHEHVPRASLDTSDLQGHMGDVDMAENKTMMHSMVKVHCQSSFFVTTMPPKLSAKDRNNGGKIKHETFVPPCVFTDEDVLSCRLQRGHPVRAMEN